MAKHKNRTLHDAQETTFVFVFLKQQIPDRVCSVIFHATDNFDLEGDIAKKAVLPLILG